jgi:hypothetical protein
MTNFIFIPHQYYENDVVDSSLHGMQDWKMLDHHVIHGLLFHIKALNIVKKSRQKLITRRDSHQHSRLQGSKTLKKN